MPETISPANSVGKVRNGWKLESATPTRCTKATMSYRGFWDVTFVKVAPEKCGNCGAPMPNLPTCKCGVHHIGWSSLYAQVTQRLHPDDLQDWR